MRPDQTRCPSRAVAREGILQRFGGLAVWMLILAGAATMAQAQSTDDVTAETATEEAPATPDAEEDVTGESAPADAEATDSAPTSDVTVEEETAEDETAEEETAAEATDQPSVADDTSTEDTTDTTAAPDADASSEDATEDTAEATEEPATETTEDASDTDTMAVEDDAEPETPMTKADGVIQSYGFNYYGDLAYPADFPHMTYVNPDAPKGGTFVIDASGTFDSMNPYSRKGRPGAMSSVMYESLLDPAAPADEYGTEYCLLCESLEYDEGKNWVIFYMRKDATFSDGTPLTAHDVVFSHELLLEQGLPSYANAVKQRITGAEVIDDYTVKFTFAPDIPRRSLIDQAGAVSVWSKKWFEETGARLDEPRMETSPGSGPYMLDSYDINRRITYKRNPEYWGKDKPINIGRHNYDEIRVEYFSDETAAFEAFKAGEYTFREETNSKQWATGYEFDAVQDGHVVLETIPDGNPPTNVGFVFNLAKEPLKDKQVREALALGYNFEWTNESLQYGLFEQRHSFFQGTEQQAEGVPQGAELAVLESLGDLVPPEVLTEPVRMAHTSSAERVLDRDNLAKADALLNDAGWVEASPPPTPPVLPPVVAGLISVLILAGAGFGASRMSGGARTGLGIVGVVAAGAVFYVFGLSKQPPDDGMRRNAEGQTLDIVIPINSSGSPTMESMVETYVQNLQQMGVNAEMQKVDPSQYTLRQRERDYDMIFAGYRTFVGAGTGLYQLYGSENADVSLFNPAGVASPLIDALIRTALEAEDSETETTVLTALDRVLRHEFFIVPAYFKADNWLAYFNMYEHPEDMPPFAVGQMDFWWVNAEKEEALKAAGALR